MTSAIVNFHPKLAIVSGAGANSARTPITKFMKNGYQVIGLTSNKSFLKLNNSQIQYVHVDRAKLDNPSYIRKIISTVLPAFKHSEYESVVALNLIGGAVVPKDSTLKHLNYALPLAFFHAAKELSSGIAKTTSIAHVSSIAASYNGERGICDYATIKKETDEAIASIAAHRTIILRPGLVLPNPTADNRIDMGHAYSPDEQPLLKTVFVIGSGNQTMQPVSEDCLYDGIIRGVEGPGNTAKIINAVGSEAMTQKEVVTYLHRAKFCLHIPYSAAHEIAEEFPLGRLAPYSVRMMETLDRCPMANKPLDMAPFAELLGRAPQAMGDLYPQKTTVVGRKSSVPDHAVTILKGISKTNRTLEFLQKVLKATPELRVSLVK